LKQGRKGRRQVRVIVAALVPRNSGLTLSEVGRDALEQDLPECFFRLRLPGFRVRRRRGLETGDLGRAQLQIAVARTAVFDRFQIGIVQRQAREICGRRGGGESANLRHERPFLELGDPPHRAGERLGRRRDRAGGEERDLMPMSR